jgi:lipid-A-disaccharide synthase
MPAQAGIHDLATPRIFLIAGEVSGDVLGARLMGALRAINPAASFTGIGGARMTEAGLVSLFPMQELALMGLAEILPRLLPLRRRIQQTIAAIKSTRPDIVVTIDSPGFCLRVLAAIKDIPNLRRIHYVAPQVWAWRQERVRKFPGLWDELLCLLPFEPAFFAPHGVNPVFVGHPVLESGADTGNAARFRETHHLAPDAIPLILLPGSRITETSRLLPLFTATIAKLMQTVPNIAPIIAAAPGVAADAIASAPWPIAPIVVRDVSARYDAFAAAAAALTKSGTSTLELAMAGVPMAVTYRVNPISAAIGRRLIKVKHVAMINLLSQTPCVPELLQENANPEMLAATLHTLLTDSGAATTQRTAFKTALATLAAPTGTPSAAAAARILP